MSMSKRDYQAIARAFYGQGHGRTTAQMLVWHALQREVADVLAADNPRFDRERFALTCTTGRCKGMKAEPAIPLCARAMGCLCAWHAMGGEADDPCDANEERAHKLLG